MMLTKGFRISARLQSCRKNTLTTRALASAFAIILLAFSLPVFAAQKDDDFKAAQAAVNAGKIEDAARLFCSVSKADPAYHNGEAAQNCKIYQDQINRENARNEERYTDGVNAFNQGNFDFAEQKFKAIHTGPHLADAQSYVSSKIPAARQSAQAGAAEAAMNGKFDQAVQAYSNNAFSSAQNLFSQVTSGSHAGEAQGYLKKIQQYQQFIQEGDSAAGSKNYKAAMDAYTQAAAIKNDGPGDPSGKSSTMRTLLAAGSGGGGGTAPPPVNTQPVQPVHAAVNNAIVEPAQPKLDIQKLLREADAAKKRGDIGVARGKYAAALAADGSNARAHAGLDSLLADNTANTQKAGSEADVLLAKGIGEFYKGQYEDAEVHIKDYISINGAKSALAYFYIASSKLTRYYLHGEQPGDHKLMTDAQDDFRSAKRTSGFAPPEKMVSPKILKIFQETT